MLNGASLPKRLRLSGYRLRTVAPVEAFSFAIASFHVPTMEGR